MTARTAIVSTVRSTGPVIQSFVKHHLSLGVERIFLFFDDRTDPAYELVDGEKAVTALRDGPELLAEWERLRNFHDVLPWLDSEVMARQMLNVAVANRFCVELGIEWLIHIDADEAILAGRGTLPEYFGRLAPKIGQVVFLNHEGVPEHAGVADYIREVTLFKRNPKLLSAEKLEGMRHLTGKRWWFMGYEDGKAAGRVHPALEAVGVQRFKLAPTAPLTLCKSVLAPTPEFMTKNGYAGEDAAASVVHTDDIPDIGHYINCGYDHYRTKYKDLGAIRDRYFGTVPILPFSKVSRDLAATGDEARIREFYEREIVFGTPGERELLLDQQILLRHEAVARRLVAPTTSV